jgi:hypothetical protein
MDSVIQSAVPAARKVATRIRSVPNPPPPAVEEVVSTHAAVCPHCARETRASLGDSATIHGACVHFAAIEQRPGRVVVIFSIEGGK